MYQKDLKIGYLLDFYGELLPERKRFVLDMYYNEDLSLAEIADEIGISRQGVRDIIKKSEEELIFFEEKLGLAEKLKQIEYKANTLCQHLTGTEISADIEKEVLDLVHLIKQ